MEIFKTRNLAEDARRTNPVYNTTDMIVKVDGGFAVMTAHDYLSWLMKH